MEDILKQLFTLNYWFGIITTVVFGLVATYLKPFIDAQWGSISNKRRLSNKRKKALFELTAAYVRDNPHQLTELRLETIYAALRVMLFILLVLMSLIGGTFIANGIVILGATPFLGLILSIILLVLIALSMSQINSGATRMLFCRDVIVEVEQSNTPSILNFILGNEELKSRAKKKLVVHSAKYGVVGTMVDVTKLVASKLSQGTRCLLVTNEEFDVDPQQGEPKHLDIEYSIGSERFNKTILENDVLLIS